MAILVVHTVWCRIDLPLGLEVHYKPFDSNHSPGSKVKNLEFHFEEDVNVESKWHQLLFDNLHLKSLYVDFFIDRRAESVDSLKLLLTDTLVGGCLP